MNTTFKTGLITGIAGVLLTMTLIGAIPRNESKPDYQFEAIQMNSEEYLLLRMEATTGKLETGWVDIENEAEDPKWVRQWTEFKKVDQ